MSQGTVILFKADKGYGFIKPDDGSANVYVHASTISGIADFGIGKNVTYDIHTDGDKKSAINVTLVGT